MGVNVKKKSSLRPPEVLRVWEMKRCNVEPRRPTVKKWRRSTEDGPS